MSNTGDCSRLDRVKGVLRLQFGKLSVGALLRSQRDHTAAGSELSPARPSPCALTLWAVRLRGFLPAQVTALDWVVCHARQRRECACPPPDAGVPRGLVV